MTLVLPSLTDMVSAEEFTLTPDQELRLMDDRERRTRFWYAPVGTPAPGPRTEKISTPEGERTGPAALVEPWLTPWLQMNDPDQDAMVGVAVLNQTDAGEGLLIMVNPTHEAEVAWDFAARLQVYLSLGMETSIQVAPPAVDYRAVFRHVRPLPKIPGTTSLRWRFGRSPAGSDRVAWEVISGGWAPERVRYADLAERPAIGPEDPSCH